MARGSSTDAQRRELHQVARRGRDARMVPRAQGLLWLGQGEHPTAIAQRLGVTREAGYFWTRRLKRESSRQVAQNFRDRSRSGRPRSKRQAMQEMVKQVTDTRPSGYGYQAEGWTAGLQRFHLRATRGIEIGENMARRCLKEMSYRWKQPGYVLARWDPFLRQAKGG